MALIAACIFTITLVWQRKEAGRGFALGLSTILIPAGPLIALTLGNWLPGLPLIALALLLIRGLRVAAARACLNDQCAPPRFVGSATAIAAPSWPSLGPPPPPST